MRQLDGSVHMGSGKINAWASSAQTKSKARRARAEPPPDLRPKHVKMRERKDCGMTWVQLADEFNFADEGGARDYLLRKERKVRPELTPRQRVSKLGLGS